MFKTRKEVVNGPTFLCSASDAGLLLKFLSLMQPSSPHTISVVYWVAGKHIEGLVCSNSLSICYINVRSVDFCALNKNRSSEHVLCIYSGFCEVPSQIPL